MGPQDREPVAVTPDVLAQTYNVPPSLASGSIVNRQAVAEPEDPKFFQRDLDTFFATYLPDLPASAGQIYQFVGNSTGQQQNEGVKAMSDIEYIMGIAPGVLSEFWFIEDSDFCGSIRDWTATILSADNPPLVHSLSYGHQGNMADIGCTQQQLDDVDLNFAKLAALGITVVVASGDDGSGVDWAWVTPDDFYDWLAMYPPLVGKQLQGTVDGFFIYDDDWAVKSCPFDMDNVDVYRQCLCHLKSTDFKGADCATTSGLELPNCSKAAWTYTLPNATFPNGTCTSYSEVTGVIPADDVTISCPWPGLYPSWPASSPWVTAVGATRFVDQKIGNPQMASDSFGSGGGFSAMFDVFQDQKSFVQQYFEATPNADLGGSIHLAGRATPDVSVLGENFQVCLSDCAGGVDGIVTSASAPTFAGMVSLLNEARIAAGMSPMGYINPFLYQHPDVFTDVVLGDNYLQSIDFFGGTFPIPGPYGFNCTEGWDPVSGLGTPIFDKLLAAAVAFVPSQQIIV